MIVKQLIFGQKYHDFVEVATETIMEYTKQIGSQHTSMWGKEEVDEIVIAQVLNMKIEPIQRMHETN